MFIFIFLVEVVVCFYGNYSAQGVTGR